MSGGKTWEPRPGKRKRLLLIGADSAGRDSISTLLGTLGWTCTSVSAQEDILGTVERDSFDAVLLDLSHYGTGAERIILGIREVRPSLSERTMVISGTEGDSEILELVERYDLPHLFRENVFSRLWSSLEDLVASPTGRKSTPRNLQIARLLSDSFRSPPPVDVRSSSISRRHFTYEHNDTIVDVLVDSLSASSRISLVGQVLDATRAKGRGDNLAVVLTGRTGKLARTTTNHMGEFTLEFEPAENLSLEIRLGERSWISVPLRHIDRLKQPPPNRATGT
jgi:CheY-like chemotaxis protein